MAGMFIVTAGSYFGIVYSSTPAGGPATTANRPSAAARSGVTVDERGVNWPFTVGAASVPGSVHAPRREGTSCLLH